MSKFAEKLQKLSPSELKAVQSQVKAEAERRVAEDPEVQFRRKVANMSNSQLSDLVYDLETHGGKGS